MFTEEKAIASKLINAALRRGYSISVYDGEEWTVKSSRERSVIVGALGTTDEDTIRLRSPSGERGGDFVLIWGNGEDVISDHSDNLICNVLFSEATR